MQARLEILTNAEMAEADRRAIAAGVPSLTLMENAGRAVADEAERMVSAGARIAVLCGPGNNGGDGFVAARLLAERGYEVRLACLVPIEALEGDAAQMARRWSGPTARAAEALAHVATADLIVDALFGAGLSRPLDGPAREVVEAIGAAGRPVLAVDVPSGLDGSTGAVLGSVVAATRTVTFFRRKPGHLLFPGRALCGEVVLADIGIPDSVLASPSPLVGESREGGDGRTAARGMPPTSGPSPQGTRVKDPVVVATFANAPQLWREAFPWPRSDGHKYSRGHAIVVSGPAERTGAARLAARGALRVGAGLVTVASPRAAFPVNAAHLTAIMLEPFEVPVGLADVLADARRNGVLIGPGTGVGAPTRRMVETALQSEAAVVLDADALTSFEGESEGDGAGDAAPRRMGFTAPTRADRVDAATPQVLFGAIAGRSRPVVVTPHEGEFKRLFADVEGSKLERARHAAAASGAIVLLKGPDTVIAAPDGRAAINENAPPWLATAGSGDVLAGFVVGLLVQGMPAFEATCAAAWLHGECASRFGPGLIAEDLSEILPSILRELAER
jgi:NAD(P)H-hydrate epimerase